MLALWILLAVVVLALVLGVSLEFRDRKTLTKNQIRERDEIWDRELGPW